VVQAARRPRTRRAPGGDAGRARRELNLATINGMAEAFRRGGKQAIDKVMKQSPAMFLKMLVPPAATIAAICRLTCFALF